MRHRLPLVLAILGTLYLAVEAQPSSTPTQPASSSQTIPNTQPMMLEKPTKVVDYTISAKVHLAAGSLQGKETLVWHNTQGRAATEIPLHLYLNAFQAGSLFLQQSESSRGNSIDATGSITISKALVDGVETPLVFGRDKTVATLALPKPIAPGASVTLSLDFVNQFPKVSARAGTAENFLMAGQWYPKPGVFTAEGWVCEPYYAYGEFFSDFGRFDVTIESPKGAVVAASGGEGDRLADAADGSEVRRFVVEDVHDFAFAVGSELESETRTLGDKTLRAVFPKGQHRSGANHLEAIRRVMPYYETWLGAYPYPWLTILEVPEDARGAGGMEYPTLITTEGISRWVLVAELTTLHEFAHQWFYGLVASNEVASAFLDEGFTNYVSSVAFDELYRSATYAPLPPIQTEDASRLQGGSVVDPIWLSVDKFRSEGSYGAASYGRTTMVLATLREWFGRDAFHAAIGAYARQYRFRHPSPNDMIASLSDSLHYDLSPVAQKLFSTTEKVDYALLSFNQESRNVDIGRLGTILLPARVRVTYLDGTTWESSWTIEEQQQDTRAWKRVLVPGEKEIARAEVQPWPIEQKQLDNAVWASSGVGDALQGYANVQGSALFVSQLALLWLW